MIRKATFLVGAQSHTCQYSETTELDVGLGWSRLVLDQHQVLQSHCIVESWYINNLPGTRNREKGPLPEVYLQTAKDTLTTPTNKNASKVHDIKEPKCKRQNCHDLLNPELIHALLFMLFCIIYNPCII